jgi:hypothetical protein
MNGISIHECPAAIHYWYGGLLVSNQLDETLIRFISLTSGDPSCAVAVPCHSSTVVYTRWWIFFKEVFRDGTQWKEMKIGSFHYPWYYGFLT